MSDRAVAIGIGVLLLALLVWVQSGGSDAPYNPEPCVQDGRGGCLP